MTKEPRKPMYSTDVTAGRSLGRATVTGEHNSPEAMKIIDAYYAEVIRRGRARRGLDS